MTPATLPAERYGPFLWVRRGVPLLGMAGALAAALVQPRLFGWWSLAAIACLAVAWPTFKSGDSYLRNRGSIVRWDGMWVRLFRPLARRLGKEDEWILAFCGWNNHRVRQAFAGRSPAPAVPAVDFATEFVVVAALGEHPTGGYMIEVAGALADAGGVLVGIRATAPGKGCPVTLAFTQPLDIVKIKRPSAGAVPVRFEEKLVSTDCGQ